MRRRTAYVALGSNVGDREGSLRWAARALQRVAGRVRVSHLFESAPLGPRQPFFLNAVAEFPWFGTGYQLLAALHEMERRRGRRRLARWGPRPLDLDLLLLGGQVARNRSLWLPHPCLRARGFVLFPLGELAPRLRPPQGGIPYSRFACLVHAGGLRCGGAMWS